MNQRLAFAITLLSSSFGIGSGALPEVERPIPLSAAAVPPGAFAAVGKLIFTFDTDPAGSAPAGWKVEATNPKGPLASWSVVADNTAPSMPNVLALTRVNQPSDATFNLCWNDRARMQDGRIEVSLKANSGTMEQGGGAIWRVADKNNYYLCNANPIDNNIRLCCVVDGARTELAKVKSQFPSGVWQMLAVEQRGESIVCWLNGTRVLEATDNRLPKAGGVGVWTRADAATFFDSLSVQTNSSQNAIQLPGGEGGIGLDELRFSGKLGRVLAPAGRTGNLALVDPESGAVDVISGFGKKDEFNGGHGDGTTSVDEGAGFLFAIDRTSMRVDVVDPTAKAIVSGAPLAANPDYVRYVAATNELWVTEPDAEQIEIFRLSKATPPVPEHVAVIAVKGGPESLIIDGKRGRAFTHLWRGGTVAIDIAQRTIAANWKNGCSGSRGIALDEARGFLFVGCAEGLAIVLDVDHDGKELSSAETGGGVDMIDYDASRGHLYVPGAKSATLTILGVSAKGELSFLGKPAIAKGAKGVTSDGNGRVFVGDPNAGSLLVIEDKFPSSRR